LQVLRGYFASPWISTGCFARCERAFQFTGIKVECCHNERFVKARTVNSKNFFAELKRRNVYKVAIVYGVAMSMTGLRYAQ
jgi:hypothetical protein